MYRQRTLGQGDETRSFRSSDESSAIDWQGPARELNVPLDAARALYLRAIRFTDEPRRAEVLYLRWLRDAAEARGSVPPAPVPGRRTHVEYEAQGRRRPRPQDPGRTTYAAVANADTASKQATATLNGLIGTTNYADVTRALEDLEKAMAAFDNAEIGSANAYAADLNAIVEAHVPLLRCAITLQEITVPLDWDPGDGAHGPH